jgi:hypothetical protein
MTYAPSAEQLSAYVVALRYTLARLDEIGRQEAGGDPADDPGFAVAGTDLPALVHALGLMVLATRRELAALRSGIDDEAGQDRAVREQLQLELETIEISAVEAEMEDSAASDRGAEQS